MADDEECYYVCDSNVTELLGNATSTMDDEVVRIKLLTSQFGEWIEPAARRFEEKMNGAVTVELIEIKHTELLPNIINEAQSQIGLYDIFVMPSNSIGIIQEYDGWADLTPFVEESVENLQDWNDIFIGARKWIAQFEGKILNYPLDADLISLFYRKDVLKYYNLTVPRTWDEYNEVTAFIHGKTFENQTLTGSCVGRNCGGMNWANLLWSSITQTQGAWSGHVFDTADMKILSGPALVQVIEWLEGHVIHGDPLEFDNCILLNTEAMKAGTCVMTYNWGNTFKQYLKQPSILRGKFGIARAPGSRFVLDRETMELVPCDEKLCKHGTYHDDIGWVNRAPYMAGGGWTCAVNNYTTSNSRRRLATEFCAFASSQAQSKYGVIPEADGNNTKNGQDPFRLSHMDASLYVSQGYEEEAAEEYLNTIRADLESENVVVDLRFPNGGEMYAVLDRELKEHLISTKLGLIPKEDLPTLRREVARRVENEWMQIISDFDQQGTARESLLTQYQRLRGVYNVEIDMNQLTPSIRGVGLTLYTLVALCAAAFAAWTVYARKSYVVKASQPFFLVMLCGGVIILGAAIVPFSIDDSVASVDGVAAACMAVPWFLCVGWTTVFSVLAAKLLRVNKVFQNSIKFKRVKISTRDVLLPFAVLLTWNIIVLLAWTLTSPIIWVREETSDTSSLGQCSSADSHLWKIYAGLTSVPNAISLLFANYEAYKSRKLSTEFGESKWIAMAMASILQVILVGIPLLFLVGENPTAEFFVRTVIVFVICMSILLLMFVPKVLAWYKDPKANATQSARSSMSKSIKSSTTSSSGLQVYQWQNSSELSKLRRELAVSKDLVEELKQRMHSEGIDTADIEQKAFDANMSSLCASSSMFNTSVVLDPNQSVKLDTSGQGSDSKRYSGDTGSLTSSSQFQQNKLTTAENAVLVMEEEEEEGPHYVRGEIAETQILSEIDRGAKSGDSDGVIEDTGDATDNI